MSGVAESRGRETRGNASRNQGNGGSNPNAGGAGGSQAQSNNENFSNGGGGQHQQDFNWRVGQQQQMEATLDSGPLRHCRRGGRRVPASCHRAAARGRRSMRSRRKARRSPIAGIASRKKCPARRASSARAGRVLTAWQSSIQPAPPQPKG